MTLSAPEPGQRAVDYKDLLHRVVAGQGVHHDEIDDVVQDALIQLDRSIGRTKHVNNGEAFATKIAKDAVRSHRRRWSRRPSTATDPTSEQFVALTATDRTEDEALAKVEITAVYAYVRKNFTLQQWEAFEALYKAGGSLSDARVLLADQLDVTPQAIDGRLRRTIRRIQRDFTKEHRR